MTIRAMILTLAAVVALGGVGAAIADGGPDDDGGAIEAIDLRKDDAGADAELVDDESDDDPTGDGDKTRGDDGTGWGHNHDRDATAGDDGTGGGDNSDYVAPAPAEAPAPAPAPAPAYDDYSDDDGVVYSAS